MHTFVNTVILTLLRKANSSHNLLLLTVYDKTEIKHLK